ncbi:MAG: SWIM zinc finger family protein [Chthoniobacterales bacterium]
MSWGPSFTPYVSAAEKRRRAKKAANVLEKTGHKLNPVRLDGRTIARSFWARAWCKNLESYSDYANRLPRGRSYVRNGSVVDLQIAPGVINALVSGSALYRITITIKPVKQAAWKALKTNCAGQVGSLMDLLQGKLSAQVMEIITRRETGLFPEPAEIGLDCSCPDWAGMCKHVAATLYAVGARLDANPELLFVLRAADHLELITEVTESVTTDVSAPADGSAMLTAESLEAVFGIEIEHTALPAPRAAVSKVAKSRSPRQTHVGSQPKEAKTRGGRNGKVSLAGKAPRSRKRAKHPPQSHKPT